MEEAISAWAQEIDEQNGSRRILDAMKAEVAHAHDALLPLLDLAHESQANWGAYDLNALLTTVVEASELSVVGGRVEVTLKLDHGEPRVWWDEERMKQVFVNLIANALDAIPWEGHIAISTRMLGGIVEARFADTGIGIPPEHLGRIFDTYFTSKPEGKGTGVGLASSRRTVERYQGTISVDSEDGIGTTVVVRPPAHPS